jgi:hypothetical protein
MIPAQESQWEFKGFFIQWCDIPPHDSDKNGCLPISEIGIKKLGKTDPTHR